MASQAANSAADNAASRVAPAKDPERHFQIAMGRVDVAEFKRNVWRAFPEEGTPYGSIFSDSYWAHRAKDFKAGDKIEVLPDEMHYYAELLVMAAGATWLKVAELCRIQLSPADVTDSKPDYNVAWRGPHRKFALIRTVDGAIIKDGFSTEREALLGIPRA